MAEKKYFLNEEKEPSQIWKPYQKNKNRTASVKTKPVTWSSDFKILRRITNGCIKELKVSTEKKTGAEDR